MDVIKLLHNRLDDVDIALLRLVQGDGKITNAELARKVQLSPPSVLQRVRRLEESGLIKGYSADFDLKSIGYHLTVFVQVSLQLHQDQPIEQFRAAVAKVKEILECHHVSGEFDFLLKVVAVDMPHFEQLVREDLSTIPAVGKIHSCFVLSTSKAERSVPI